MTELWKRKCDTCDFAPSLSSDNRSIFRKGKYANTLQSSLCAFFLSKRSLSLSLFVGRKRQKRDLHDLHSFAQPCQVAKYHKSRSTCPTTNRGRQGPRGMRKKSSETFESKDNTRSALHKRQRRWRFVSSSTEGGSWFSTSKLIDHPEGNSRFQVQDLLRTGWAKCSCHEHEFTHWLLFNDPWRIRVRRPSEKHKANHFLYFKKSWSAYCSDWSLNVYKKVT